MINPSEFECNWSFLKEKDVFVACSGGVDSMVLLHLLSCFCENITVLHVNYQLRGTDSGLDEKLVCDWAKKNKKQVEVKRIDTLKFLEKNGGNLQEETRKMRYGWFSEQVSGSNSVLLLAHHLDDQIETFYQHLARKSGISGLSCMPEQHGNTFRPLLHFSKEEIYAFAKAQKIAWREDVSNSQNKYTRNKLRNEILPGLYSQIPGLKSSVLLLVRCFQETRLELENSVSDLLKSIKENGFWSFDDFDSLDSEQKIIVLRGLGFEPTALSELDLLRKRQKGKKIVNTFFSLIRDKNGFFFQKNTSKNFVHSLKIERISSLPTVFSKDEIYLDASKISGELKLLPWSVGDRIYPLGMSGSKLISDVLTESAVPNHLRSGCLVVKDEKKIHWCVGYKIGRFAIADQSSQAILKLTVVNSSG